MPRNCIQCREVYDAIGGGPMISLCGQCLAANHERTGVEYVERNGILIKSAS